MPGAAVPFTKSIHQQHSMIEVNCARSGIMERASICSIFSSPGEIHSVGGQKLLRVEVTVNWSQVEGSLRMQDSLDIVKNNMERAHH